jgi:hypothetical protein
VDPVSGYVNSHIVERADLQLTKHNSLLLSYFLASCDTDRLKYHRKQPSKNNNKDNQN